MASNDDRKWNPYETSQKRDFVVRPRSPIPFLRPATSKAYRNPYALASPIGVTVYSEDFCWKPPSKPECIQTGTAKRNNPHPSQDFMVWRHPSGLNLCENPPPEDEVKNALSAQYKSTYRTDFLGIPQVPTVVSKHITTQESTELLTTYDRHFGGKSTDFASVLSSLQPEELQHFYKHLPEKEKHVVQTILQKKPSPPGQRKKIMEPVAFMCPPAELDRISVWPGPV